MGFGLAVAPGVDDGLPPAGGAAGDGDSAMAGGGVEEKRVTIQTAIQRRNQIRGAHIVKILLLYNL